MKTSIAEHTHIDDVDGKAPVFSDSAQALKYGQRFQSARFSEEALKLLPRLAPYRGEQLKVSAHTLIRNILHGQDELLFHVKSLSRTGGVGDGYFFARALTALSTREPSPQIAMVRMQTRELIGAALDWAVARCELVQILGDKTNIVLADSYAPYNPSTDQTVGGWIIDEKSITTTRSWNGTKPQQGPQAWRAEIQFVDGARAYGSWAYGATRLVAAMRSYVAGQYGEIIEIPSILIES